MLFPLRLKLLLGLRGNYVVMAMKIEGAFPLPVARGETRRSVSREEVLRRSFEMFELQAQCFSSAYEELCKFVIMLPWRIFRRHGNEIG